MARFPVTCRRRRSRNFPVGICAAISVSPISPCARSPTSSDASNSVPNKGMGFDASPLFRPRHRLLPFNDWLRFDLTGEYRSRGEFSRPQVILAAAALSRTNTAAASRNGYFCLTAISISVPGAVSRRLSAPASVCRVIRLVASTMFARSARTAASRRLAWLSPTISRNGICLGAACRR